MRKDVLLRQWKIARTWLLRQYDKTDEKLFHTIPQGFPNSLHWQFGHVAAMSEILSVTLFGHEDEVAERFKKYFGYGTSPNDFDDDTPRMEDIKQLLDSQLVLFENDLTEEQLDMTREADEGNAKDNGALMGGYIIHEALHVGKIEEMRRVLELEAK